jgi:hypothetical protein
MYADFKFEVTPGLLHSHVWLPSAAADYTGGRSSVRVQRPMTLIAPPARTQHSLIARLPAAKQIRVRVPLTGEASR